MSTKNISTRLFLATILSTSMLLTACQLGAPEAPSDKDMDNASEHQTTQIQSNTAGGQGGTVVSSDNGDSENANGDNSKASKKTSFDDLWMLDSVTADDGTEVMSSDDVLYYGTTYEIVCAMELYDDEDGKRFACTFPGTDWVGRWEENGEFEATLTIPISATESHTAQMKMSTDYQTATLTFPDDAEGTVYNFHRDDDTTLTLGQMYEDMVTQNDEFFNKLPIDTQQDVTFVDDDKITIRLLGTTHTDDHGMVGYLLDITNKTTQSLIVNDFVEVRGGTLFTLNGAQEPIQGLTGRVLPPMVTDEETGKQRMATMRCAILFSAEDTGGALTSCSGNLIITDYHWNELGRYSFNV